jgi:uncharacterized UPF0160 family protein
MKIVTHNGHFHADELMAVATLLIKYPDAEVVRSRDMGEVDSADIAVDVGQVYDPEKLRFDHHQTSGAGKRPNGIPYASFGLVWRHFGEEVSGGKEEAKVVEERLVMPIDAIDNAVIISVPQFEGVREYSVGDYFESLADGCYSPEDYDAAFFQALSLARDLIKREIKAAQVSVTSWQKVRDIYNASENKSIIVLEESLRWKRALIPTDALFVIFPRTDGRWTARAVPKEINGFEVKKTFPLSWSGLSDGRLQGVSGVNEAFFCHRDCYLCVAATKEGAIKLAEKALNS